ncbi:unnamed protein product [Zymoseptoria tritici ST99CH_3D1]|uniref:Uncharacterized protein n=1 Tax=Zymoseptoria tritici (strain ST99CH_3D7) TaxID=1276538 RepID=A0A1X7RQ49_ZYMT9|nr:unnamed protein product [Zymoseptoria tritici ST99CH_3D7]SMR51457.1 unnamed protein product [Zymoseptoria tritici ST99CH_3D1]
MKPIVWFLAFLPAALACGGQNVCQCQDISNTQVCQCPPTTDNDCTSACDNWHKYVDCNAYFWIKKCKHCYDRTCNPKAPTTTLNNCPSQ